MSCTSKIYSSLENFVGGGGDGGGDGEGNRDGNGGGDGIAKATAMATWKVIRKAKGKATVLIK